MQSFTWNRCEKCKQHKGAIVPSLRKDSSDALKTVTYHVDRKTPFDSSNMLMNISTGEVYNSTVHVHNKKKISVVC